MSSIERVRGIEWLLFGRSVCILNGSPWSIEVDLAWMRSGCNGC